LLAELHRLQDPLKKKLAALESPYRQKVAERKKSKLEQEFRDALAVPDAKRTPEQKKLANQAANLIRVSWDEILKEMTPTDRQTKADLRAKLHELEAKRPQPAPRAWSIEDNPKLPATHLLYRGDPKKKGPELTAAPPRVLVDPKALLFLLGTEMDYKTEKLAAQFVFNNPNQTSACGCGESVQLKPAAEAH